MMPARLYLTCVHEAAHAVFFALAGIPVDSVHVSEAGGSCVITDVWSSADAAQPRRARAYVQQGGGFVSRDKSPLWAKTWHRRVRGAVVATLAGEAAVCQSASSYPAKPRYSIRADGQDDLSSAVASVRLFSEDTAAEIEHAIYVVQIALDDPYIRARVEQLAVALMERRVLDAKALKAFLPKAVSYWPPAPGASYDAIRKLCYRASGRAASDRAWNAAGEEVASC